jgi:hypothetical protein
MKFWSNSDTPPPGSSVPEKRLLAAVLQRAISDFIGGEGEIREGARAWIMEEDCADAPLSFSFICEALDLEKVSLRKAILLQAMQPVPAQGVMMQEAMN